MYCVLCSSCDEMIPIETERFRLLPLTVEYVNDRYLSWLDPKNNNGYIVYGHSDLTLNRLREYVSSREGKDDVLFLAITDKESNQHVGNIKYEPIDLSDKTATMVILIGEKSWRNKGVAKEVILETAHWLKINKDIREIILGADKDNIQALTAYKKIGFLKIGKTDTGIRMSLKL